MVRAVQPTNISMSAGKTNSSVHSALFVMHARTSDSIPQKGIAHCSSGHRCAQGYCDSRLLECQVSILSHFSSGTKARLVENDRTQRRKLVWDFSVAIKYFPTSEHVLVLNFRMAGIHRSDQTSGHIMCSFRLHR